MGIRRLGADHRDVVGHDDCHDDAGCGAGNLDMRECASPRPRICEGNVFLECERRNTTIYDKPATATIQRISPAIAMPTGALPVATVPIGVRPPVAPLIENTDAELAVELIA